MDCQLPEVDGYEATRRIRALPERGGLPIVALTASAAPDDLERCFRSGMDDHVAKPVDMQRLLDVIARHLGGQRGRRSERRPSGELPVADFTRALARLNGDLSLLERIAKQFSEGAGESWAKLRAAVLDRDSAAARFAAHRLAGQASSFDGAVLVDALRALQEMLLRNDWAAARDTLPCVEKELERLVRIVAAQGKDLTTTA
jgi:response regulator RpfG family c-di-GMP phosphodiesterase